MTTVTDYEKELLAKIDAGTPLADKELEYCVWETEEIAEIEGDDYRWQREMETIFKLDGRFFSIGWMKGLTEGQDNSFYDNPTEVTSVKRQITVIKWVIK